MAVKKFNSFKDLVYSTNPEAMNQPEEEDVFTPPATEQTLEVLIDNKRRKGKTVTLVLGFEGSDEALDELGKKLKVKCGTGGSVKNSEIIIQGNCKDIVLKWLKEWGYRTQ